MDSNELLESLDIFRGARIHGIQYSSHNETVVAFGGKLLAVVALNRSQSAVSRFIIRLMLDSTDLKANFSTTESG